LKLLIIQLFLLLMVCFSRPTFPPLFFSSSSDLLASWLDLGEESEFASYLAKLDRPPLILIQGKTLNIPPKFKFNVLLCQPLLQGVISEDTNVIVTDSSAKSKPTQSSKDSIEEDDLLSSITFPSMESNLSPHGLHYSVPWIPESLPSFSQVFWFPFIQKIFYFDGFLALISNLFRCPRARYQRKLLPFLLRSWTPLLPTHHFNPIPPHQRIPTAKFSAL